MTRVATIGGGIGGATAGCALAQAGLEMSVYEAAPELKEIGAGHHDRATPASRQGHRGSRCRLDPRVRRDLARRPRLPIGATCRSLGLSFSVIVDAVSRRSAASLV